MAAGGTSSTSDLTARFGTACSVGTTSGTFTPSIMRANAAATSLAAFPALSMSVGSSSLSRMQFTPTVVPRFNRLILFLDSFAATLARCRIKASKNWEAGATAFLIASTLLLATTVEYLLYGTKGAWSRSTFLMAEQATWTLPASQSMTSCDVKGLEVTLETRALTKAESPLTLYTPSSLMLFSTVFMSTARLSSVSFDISGMSDLSLPPPAEAEEEAVVEDPCCCSFKSSVCLCDSTIAASAFFDEADLIENIDLMPLLDFFKAAANFSNSALSRPPLLSVSNFFINLSTSPRVTTLPSTDVRANSNSSISREPDLSASDRSKTLAAVHSSSVAAAVDFALAAPAASFSLLSLSLFSSATLTLASSSSALVNLNLSFESTSASKMKLITSTITRSLTLPLSVSSFLLSIAWPTDFASRPAGMFILSQGLGFSYFLLSFSNICTSRSLNLRRFISMSLIFSSNPFSS
mmetsp:Transcript_26296/g.49750  ORF Transcript_26296/g.49750 Transcript_26296/m.49750 type:complete len:467 (-) Transcript_26296:940-2340(-)